MSKLSLRMVVAAAAAAVALVAPAATAAAQVPASAPSTTAVVAPFYGSLANVHLNRPVVGMAATPDGKGYWLVAADGGVFTFGDAAFYGSAVGRHGVLGTEPFVGIASAAQGHGYWLFQGTAGAGVYAFGAAPDGIASDGCVAGAASAPEVQATPTSSDGALVRYGCGSDVVLRPAPVAPLVGALPASAGGEWLYAADGGVFTAAS